ncbi:MAG: EFR1 family ferrodoxin [Candidatus Hodarchaeota archaeon]
MIVILSYFHTRIGPSIFYSFPKTKLDEEIAERIYEVMNQPKKEEFLTQTFEGLKLLNYYFQIRSEWARGKKEMLMLSIMTTQQISTEIEETISNLCKKFSKKMQSNEQIFTGFHIKEIKNHNESDKELIRKNETIINNSVRDLYWEILEDTKKISEEEKITLLLDDRYIFESLEKMSDELKKVSKEIKLSEDFLRPNSVIRNSILNLNKIIEDLYEGYIEKMTGFDIDDESGLFSAEDELDLDIQERKKELIKVLKGEVIRKYKTIIYYFTGTGNSLKIAKDLAKKLEDCEIIPIAKVWQMENPESTTKKVGFIFPLYWSGLPKIVHDFINKINLSNSNYIFTVITSTGDINEQPLQQLEKILKKKAKTLSAGFYVNMPNNYIIGFDIDSEDRQKELFEKAIKQVNSISEIVKNEEENINQDIFQKDVSRSEGINKNFREKVNDSDKSFYIDDSCNNCGICEKVCPVSNIMLIDGIPQWQHRCQQCLACINFCPEKSIQFGTETLKTQRYHHPQISLKEIMNQKKSISPN